MASTFSTNLAIELIGTGDQAGTWGVTTNTNLGTLIEQAISGYVTQAVSTGGDTTITIPNGATGVARNMYIELTGTGGTNTNLIVPSNKKLYFIFNNTSSGQVTVKVSGQTGVSVPNKAKAILVSNGTDIVDATNYIGSAVISNLTATSATITTLASTSANISVANVTTKVVTPFVDAVGSAGGALRNASGTAQVQWGAGGGSNFSVDVAGNFNPANANISIAPTGTGTVTINPATAGTMNNVAIGGSTAAAGSFTTLTTSSTVTLNGGTANGVLYLNGSKVATSGSALVFDGTNLGIGTSSPSAKLSVSSGNIFVDNANGSVIVRNADSTNQQQIRLRMSGTDGVLDTTRAAGTATNLIFGTEGVERARIDSNGNFGIGTSSPVGKLDVVSASGSGNAVYMLGGNYTDRLYATGIRFLQPASTVNANRQARFTSGDSALTIQGISSNDGADTSDFNILLNPNGGNLGIGTTAPTFGNGSGVEIQQAGTATLRLENSSASNSFEMYVDSAANGINLRGRDSSPMIFWTGNTERARITSDGNLAVGIAGASYRIQSSVDSGANRDMFLSGVSGVTNGVYWSWVNSTSSIAFKINALPTTASAANAYLDGADDNRLYRSTSSIRYKKDVESIDSQYSENALNLRPVWYRSKAAGDKQEWSWYGLIAEEVAEVDPRLVHWSYAEEDYDVQSVEGEIKRTPKPDAKMIPDGVQYERLSVLLLDIVKKQNARIEQLEAKVAALESK